MPPIVLRFGLALKVHLSNSRTDTDRAVALMEKQGRGRNLSIEFISQHRRSIQCRHKTSFR